MDFWWEKQYFCGHSGNILYSMILLYLPIEAEFFTPVFKDVKKDFSLFSGDSVSYLASFEDDAIGRSLKIQTAL